LFNVDKNMSQEMWNGDRRRLHLDLKLCFLHGVVIVTKSRRVRWGNKKCTRTLANNSWYHLEGIWTDEMIFKVILKIWVEYFSWLEIKPSMGFVNNLMNLEFL
jgi:hypothetical protein